MLSRYAYGVMALLAALSITIQAAAQTPVTTPTVQPASTSASKELFLKEGIEEDFGKLPTYINSDSLTLKSEERVFVYSGNVEVRQGDMTLTADTLEGRYSASNEIEQLVAQSNVVITKGTEIRATGQKAIYEAATGIATLTDSPELMQNESVLTADSIKIFLKENRSVAEGTVRMRLVKKEELDRPESFLGR